LRIRDFQPCIKVSRVVLPVHFKQATACMVPRTSYETYGQTESTNEKPAENTCGFPAGIHSIGSLYPADNPSQYKSRAIDGMKELHKEPAGQRLMLLFKIDELIPFDPAFLDNSSQPVALHAKLQEQFHRRASAE
jgi:hypothetical protein